MTNAHETKPAGLRQDDETTAIPSATAAQPRSWLPVFAVVCLMAVLGGAGAVLLAPGGAVMTTEGGVRTGSRVVRVMCETKVEPNVFNLRSSRGATFAKVAFRFEYHTRPDWRAVAAQRVSQNWDRMLSEVLRTLKRCTAYELNSDVGLKALEADLEQNINDTLFSESVNGQPLARVDGILWLQVLVQ